MSCDNIETGLMDAVYVATNMAHYATWFELPSLPNEYKWQLCFNTGDSGSPYQAMPVVFNDSGILAGERSLLIFTVSPRET